MTKTSVWVKPLPAEQSLTPSALADQKLRFERATARKSASDFVSFEKFKEQEKLENENSDPSKQNILACINMADFIVNNDWNIEELHKQLDEIIC